MNDWESSSREERGGAAVLSHFLLEALQGKGDANADGIITFTETFDHVSKSVVGATQGRRNPQRAGLGDVPIAAVGMQTAASVVQ